MEEPQKIPDWLATGITYLLPKSRDSKAVRNYQPITCLTTLHNTPARRVPTPGRTALITSCAKKDVSLEVKGTYRQEKLQQIGLI
jgi:hypothetical protein